MFLKQNLPTFHAFVATLMDSQHHSTHLNISLYFSFLLPFLPLSSHQFVFFSFIILSVCDLNRSRKRTIYYYLYNMHIIIHTLVHALASQYSVFLFSPYICLFLFFTCLNSCSSNMDDLKIFSQIITRN